MKRLPLFSCIVAVLLGILFLWAASGPARGDYLGSWKIDDVVEIRATTSQFSTGNKYVALPIQCKVYEGSTAAEIVDVNMTQFDSKTGFYGYSLALASATGFEKGKHYTVLVEATVDGVTANAWHNFQIQAEVDADTVSDKTGYALTQTFPTNFSSLAINADGTADSNVVYVRGETPETDVTDTLNTRINGVDANVAAVKTVTDALPDAGALTTLSSLVADIKAVTDDIGGLSEIGDKVVADMDANSVSAVVDFNDLGNLSTAAFKTPGTWGYWINRIADLLF